MLRFQQFWERGYFSDTDDPTWRMILKELSRIGW